MAMKKQELNYIMNKTRDLKKGPCLFLGRAQAAFEYAIILAIVVTAMTAMQVYFKRGIQAGIRICSDELGEQKKGLGEKIDLESGIFPGASTHHSVTESTVRLQIEKGEERTLNIDESTTTTGHMVSKPFALQPVSGE